MSPDEGGPYLLHDDPKADGWVTPAPAEDAVIEALTAETDLEADDIDALESYVDLGAIEALLADEDGAVSFEVEGHDVTVDAGGQVSVGG